MAARLGGAKHIISSKRDMGDLKSAWHLFMNRRCRGIFSGIIAVCNAVAQRVAENERISQSKIRTIYNGVDIIQFAPFTQDEALASRQQFGLCNDDYILGMVAGFRPEKNYNIFFEGAGKFLKTIKNLKLLVIGDGPLRRYFEKYCAERELNGRVIFPGAVGDVRPYLKCMDVACLLPARNEGFSNAILEKMALGLPLIVSDVGGNSEAVIHGKNGLVIPANNVDAFSDAVLTLFSDDKMRKKMGECSRRLVEEKFSLEAMGKNHEEFYRTFLSRT
jgi:glycosyltransferase involved in cell wall biosynthesis